MAQGIGLKAGTVAPSAILRRLAAYPRQNALAKALKEIGRLERTLFTLDWISDPALRPENRPGRCALNLPLEHIFTPFWAVPLAYDFEQIVWRPHDPAPDFLLQKV